MKRPYASGSRLSRQLLAGVLLLSGCADLAAGDSDSAYGLFGGIGYVFNKSLSTVVGYRYMKLDYEKGDFLFDVEMAGPTAGVAFHW